MKSNKTEDTIIALCMTEEDIDNLEDIPPMSDRKEFKRRLQIFHSSFKMLHMIRVISMITTIVTIAAVATIIPSFMCSDIEISIGITIAVILLGVYILSSTLILLERSK